MNGKSASASFDLSIEKIPTKRFTRPEDFEQFTREAPPTIDLNRRTGISEVEVGYTEEQAKRQAERCLSCHVQTIYDADKCVMCNRCVDVCPEYCLKLVPLADLEIDAGMKTQLLEHYNVDPFSQATAGDKDAFWSAASHLILPTIVLGTNPLAVIARMTRSAMLEVLGEDYIRTARAKGLSNLRVVGLHALRNALIPVVTVIGLQIGVLFTGAILTETIFSWPGVGKWMIEAIGRRDYPVLQGGILLLGSMVMLVNLLVDVTYGIINPRIRH